MFEIIMNLLIIKRLMQGPPTFRTTGNRYFCYITVLYINT